MGSWPLPRVSTSACSSSCLAIGYKLLLTVFVHLVVVKVEYLKNTRLGPPPPRPVAAWFSGRCCCPAAVVEALRNLGRGAVDSARWPPGGLPWQGRLTSAEGLRGSGRRVWGPAVSGIYLVFMVKLPTSMYGRSLKIF